MFAKSVNNMLCLVGGTQASCIWMGSKLCLVFVPLVFVPLAYMVLKITQPSIRASVIIPFYKNKSPTPLCPCLDLLEMVWSGKPTFISFLLLP